MAPPRYLVPADDLPPGGSVLMTAIGAIIVSDVSGECVEDEIAGQHWLKVSTAGGPVVWAPWRRPQPRRAGAGMAIAIFPYRS
jgi:hypothetical protein